MRLDELINCNYNKLNENDLLIWQYIQNHKKECCAISIEELAENAVFPGPPFPDLHKNFRLKVFGSLRYILNWNMRRTRLRKIFFWMTFA